MIMMWMCRGHIKNLGNIVRVIEVVATTSIVKRFWQHCAFWCPMLPYLGRVCGMCAVAANNVSPPG